VELRIAELADAQHGIVTRHQLLALGLSRGAIGARVSRGGLHRVHRGVYAVGHRALSVRARWMAATLAGGSGALLSHRSAAALWGLRASEANPIELTAARRLMLGPSVLTHRSVIPAEEATVREGIPVTSPFRTLLDLAAVAPRRVVERTMKEADVLRLTDRVGLPELLERYPRRRGTATVRAILADSQLGSGVTKSELEELFKAFLQEEGLPTPRFNSTVWVGGSHFEPDCVWDEQRVAVELDSRMVHATVAAFEADRAKDRLLQAVGWRIVRVTWRQLHRERAPLAVDLRALLGRGAELGDGQASGGHRAGVRNTTR
jgi:very-short-patch-repair endonuclease